MAEHDFNTLMAALDSPLIVVTTADERERAGCLVEFHVQSSIEPQRYCVWLSKANYTYRVALQSSHLVIHFLTADDLSLAELFALRPGIPSTSSPASRWIRGRAARRCSGSAPTGWRCAASRCSTRAATTSA
jgi:flavin reductase (DIM6/NTAB) family NADH-FMN oxidoreductase RutF